MTLEQLRIFVAVAQMEHFTRAADRLKLSQSAVSSAISALEVEHHLQLFDRTRRHVELTAAGNVLLAEAEAIISRVSLALRRIEDLSELRRGHLSVAASQTVANYWLPPFLQQFHQQYPGVTIDLWHGNSTRVEKRIVQGEVDIGFIEQEPRDRSLEVEQVAFDELITVVGPLHSWFGIEHVALSRLPETTWIMREPGSGTRALFEDALKQNGFDPESLEASLTLRTGEAVLGAVRASNSAAVVSSLVAKAALKAGELHQVNLICIPRAFAAISLPGRAQPKTVKTFIDMMRRDLQIEDDAKVTRLNGRART